MHATQTWWERIAWWLGVPIAVAAAVAGPYWIRALALGRADWFRIPLVGDAVFDTSAYLQPVGHAVLGLMPEAALIGWFAFVIRALAVLLPGASLAELWLVSRWISGVGSIWIGAWTVRNWSGLFPRGSRFVSAAFWIAVALVIGMKPGVFSWYLPAGLFGAGIVPLVARALEERRFFRAVCWSLLAAAVTSVYTWYVLFTLLWLGATWGAWFARRMGVRGASTAMAIVVAAGSVVAGVGAAWVTSTEAGHAAFEAAVRFSLTFTRMPFVSGSVILTFLWTLLLIPVARRTVGDMARRVELAWTAWVVILLGFLHSPFTGAFIQNDHFRSVAAICSWLTLALLWNVTRSSELRPKRVSRATIGTLVVCAIVSAFFTIKILLAPYAWNGDLLNVVQLAHWFALLVACLIVIRWIRGAPALHARRFVVIIGIGALVIGGVGWSAALAREFRGMSAVEPWMPLFSWVNTHVPANAPVCANHGGQGFNLDDQLSAVTGRVVHFANSTQYHRERSTVFLDRLRTITGFYRADAAGDEEILREFSGLSQFLTCVQFPLHQKILRTFNVPQDRINRMIGCQQQSMDARWNSVHEAIVHPVPHDAAFKSVCPFVVVTDRAKPFWTLPNGYAETRVMDGVSVWSAASK